MCNQLNQLNDIVLRSIFLSCIANILDTSIKLIPFYSPSFLTSNELNSTNLAPLLADLAYLAMLFISQLTHTAGRVPAVCISWNINNIARGANTTNNDDTEMQLGSFYDGAVVNKIVFVLKEHVKYLQRRTNFSSEGYDLAEYKPSCLGPAVDFCWQQLIHVNRIDRQPVTCCPGGQVTFIMPAYYSLSNVIMADEKSTLFHQYLRYSHKYGTIVFSIPGAIQWV